MLRLAFVAWIAGMACAYADLAPYTCTRDRYVATNGVDAPGRGTQSLPWRTLQYANSNGGLAPGDCVNAAPGTYTQSGGLTLNKSGNANTPTGFIVWKGASNRASKISGTANLFLVAITGNYIILDGFEVDAPGSADYAVAVPSSLPGHHIGVYNNLIHHSIGGGIGFTNYDYYDVIGNEVHHTAAGSCCGLYESGISAWNLKRRTPDPNHPADAAPFHTRILRNIVYDNVNQHPWSPSNPHTDGNGIIIDATNGSQGDGVDYGQQILVQSNLVHHNGGRGIHVFFSHKVTVANNTLYGDMWDIGFTGTSRGELSNVCANNNKWQNNLAIAVPGTGDTAYNKSVVDATYFIGGCSNSNVVWQNNLTWRGITSDPSANFNDIQNGASKLAAFVSANFAGVDPLLVDTVSFVPSTQSPAINAGIATPEYPPTDIVGALMPSPPYIGAVTPLALSKLLLADSSFLLLAGSMSKFLLSN